MAQKHNDTCPICANEFTKVKRSPTKCPTCSFNACHDCVKRYLNWNLDDPNCMNCKVDWKMDKYFICKPSYLSGEFAQNRGQILFEREMARKGELLAAHKLKKVIHASEDFSRRVIYLGHIILEFVEQQDTFWWISGLARQAKDFQFKIPHLDEKLDKIRLKLNELYVEWDECMHSKELYTSVLDGKFYGPLVYKPFMPWAIDVNKQSGSYVNPKKPIPNLKVFQERIKDIWDETHEICKEIRARQKSKHSKICTIRCMYTGCRGLCSDDGICVLCDKLTCTSCLSEKYPNHVCDPEVLASVKMIREDTTSCPGCGTGIAKSHGCDLAWCVFCHTMFSFETGQRRTGKNHNPEYYEYYRKKVGELARDPDEHIGPDDDDIMYDDNERLVWLSRPPLPNASENEKVNARIMYHIGQCVRDLAERFPMDWEPGWITETATESRRQHLASGFDGIINESEYKRALVSYERNAERVMIYAKSIEPTLRDLRAILMAYLRKQGSVEKLLDDAALVAENHNSIMEKIKRQIVIKPKILYIGKDEVYFPTPIQNGI